MTLSAARTPERLGGYELVEKLGQGGMAEVWKARAHGPGGFVRLLVVKRILPQLAADPTFVKLFQSEARISARLMHPNIVQVYGFGEERGEYFLAMEYVEGRDLIVTLRRLAAGTPIDPGLGAYAVREICRALAYAHGLAGDDGRPLDIVHRDVSPSNVMLAATGGVKLLDFGVAKMMDADKTNTRSIRGKFGYMAPELLDGKIIDARADLFAAGVVLHEALSGKRLFLGANQLDTVAQVRSMLIPLPSEINPRVPPELDAICMKALERDRERRYQSGVEMAMALDEVVHHLRWGPERLAELLRDTFSDQASEKLAAAPTVLSDPPRRRSRSRLGLAAAGAALLAGSGAAWRWHRAAPAIASIAPAPASPRAAVVAPVPVAAVPVAAVPVAVAPVAAVPVAAAPVAAPTAAARAKTKPPAATKPIARAHHIDRAPPRQHPAKKPSPGDLADPFARR